MQTAVLIQRAIRRQATARVRLPSPIAQFKTFLNRGAKPSPEDKAGTPPPPPPEKEEKGETPPPPENGGGEGGIDWEGGEPTGESADAGVTQDAPDAPAGASQDAPEPTQGASEGGAGEILPPTLETPQGEAKDAPAKRRVARQRARRSAESEV